MAGFTLHADDGTGTAITQSDETCIWQVSGRNEIPDFDKWAELDLEYIDNWSLKKDFELILKTIPAVFSGLGAR